VGRSTHQLALPLQLGGLSLQLRLLFQDLLRLARLSFLLFQNLFLLLQHLVGRKGEEVSQGQAMRGSARM